MFASVIDFAGCPENIGSVSDVIPPGVLVVVQSILDQLEIQIFPLVELIVEIFGSVSDFR